LIYLIDAKSLKLEFGNWIGMIGTRNKKEKS